MLAFKIGLEKSYCRLNWDFIKDTLTNIGFSDHFCNIMNCVSSCHMKIFWNGEVIEGFKTSRGIIQSYALKDSLT